jgi:hypothetical protein
MDKGVNLMKILVQTARAIGEAFPQATPEVAEINNLVQRIIPKIMEGAKTPEPMAPPTNG